MTLFGWTMKQLGAAKAHFSQVSGKAVEPTLAGALEVQVWWISRRHDQPLEVALVGVKPDTDLDWACKVWQCPRM